MDNLSQYRDRYELQVLKRILSCKSIRLISEAVTDGDQFQRNEKKIPKKAITNRLFRRSCDKTFVTASFSQPRVESIKFLL